MYVCLCVSVCLREGKSACGQSDCSGDLSVRVRELMNGSALLNANHCRFHGLNEKNKDLLMFIFRCRTVNIII